MREKLHFLYGPEAGDRTHFELERVLAEFRPRLHRQTDSAAFDERDAVLITYGDTFIGPAGPPLAALRAFAADHLKDEVSALHLLPFFPYSSDYGFAVVDYERVNPELGAWEEVAALHADFELMFDFVLNHVSVESEWFQAFLRDDEGYRDFFITMEPGVDLSSVTRPRVTPLLTRFETAAGESWVWTTFGPDQADLNYANPEVLLRMIRIMLTYVERGADLLRMDAVGYLWKQVGTACIHLPQTHAIVKLFREVLDAVAPQVLIVTETNVAHPDNVSYFGEGSDEAQAVYQFPLAPLVLDAFARVDGTALTRWAQGLSAPSPKTTFFNFLASHDGIGVVPVRGLLPESAVANLAERVRAHGGEVSMKTEPDGSQSPYELNATLFDALSDPGDRDEPWATKLERFLCAHSIMLTVAGVPGVYVHSLFGSHNDHAAYAKSGWRRDLNHGRLELADLEERLKDGSSQTGQVFARMAELLRRRRAQPAFHPNSAQEVLDLGPSVFAVRRGPHEGRTVLALHNLSSASQELRLGPDGWRLAPYQFLWLTDS